MPVVHAHVPEDHNWNKYESCEGNGVSEVNLNETLMREIAAETGGLYFRARDNASLENIYAEIDKLEKSDIQISALKRYSEKFFPFALAAAILLLTELILRYTLFKKYP